MRSTPLALCFLAPFCLLAQNSAPEPPPEPPVEPAQRNETTREEALVVAVRTIDYIWTEWMLMDPLDPDELGAEQVAAAIGSWSGDSSEGARVREQRLLLREDGSYTWHEHDSEPTEGRWYQGGNYLLLYSGQAAPEEREANLATAIVLLDGVFNLILADDDDGLVPLVRLEDEN